MVAVAEPTATHTHSSCHHDCLPSTPIHTSQTLPSSDLAVTSHPAGDDAVGSGGEPTTTASNCASSGAANHNLPEELLRLADASAPVSLPPPHTVPRGSLDNRELDKLVGTLGRNKATWRRALVLSQWLQDSGHMLDDRLCTTVRTECGGRLVCGCLSVFLSKEQRAPGVFVVQSLAHKG